MLTSPLKANYRNLILIARNKKFKKKPEVLTPGLILSI